MTTPWKIKIFSRRTLSKGGAAGERAGAILREAGDEVNSVARPARAEPYHGKSRQPADGEALDA
jgi:hypothetical protein